MNSRRITSILVVVAGCWLGTSAPAGWQTERNGRTPAPGVEVALTMTLSTYGVVGAGHHGWAKGAAVLDATEMRGAQVLSSGCDAGYASRFDEMDVTPSGDNPIVAWGVEGRLVSVEGDAATVDVHWTRRVSTSAVAPSSSEEWRGRLTLRDGESRPFDLVRVAEGRLPCAWYVPEFGVEFLDPPQVKDAVLRYDLWLIHRERDGTERVENARMVGRQGARVEYAFTPMHHSLEGVPIESARPDALKTTLHGQVTGRARADGLIDLTVETWRDVTVREGSRGNSGTKRLTVKPHETIEIVVPPARAESSFDTAGNGSSRVDAATAFEGQHTAIRVTTTRLK